ncbi:MAG: DUF4412 domain-containing protein [Balneolaceae bacterium]|nr:DUF4412 domain-containing protein [Balneolaceae bacterium]
MKKSVYLLFAFCLITAIPTTLFAQFEGKIKYATFDVENGVPESDEEFTVYFALNRIFLEGDKTYDVRNFQTEGILVRMDMEDVVFFTGDESALKISKADVDAMQQFFGKESGDTGKESNDFSFKRTGKTESIHGLACEQFVFRDEDDPEKYTEVWMTKDLETDLSSLVRSAETFFDGEDVPTGLLAQGYFPLKANFYNGNKLSGYLEATEVDETRSARAKVEVPAGIKVYNFQQYLFQRFSQSGKKQK